METPFHPTMWSNIMLWGLFVYVPVMIIGVHLATSHSKKNPGNEAIFDHEVFSLVFFVFNLGYPAVLAGSLQHAGAFPGTCWAAAAVMWVSSLVSMVTLSMYREDKMSEKDRSAMAATRDRVMQSRLDAR